MSDLLSKKCVPCEGGTEPLSATEIADLSPQVPEWTIATDSKSISMEFVFKDFVTAVVFITDVAHIAEEEGHHPDLNLHNWNKVLVTLSTHAIKGLSENDFIMAAKIDQVHAEGAQ
ncbi:MAG: 4a-hydroxytetrahydrobiopterin dehydratase [Patescibacteria group bacterium]